MDYFADRYCFERMGKAARIIAIAAAHHRFNYIHPFADGNGRVSRLMSHAMAYVAGIGAHGLWSVSRGLARGLESRGGYKQMMDYADTPRQGDLDGPGNLSQRALTDFVLWFLRVCLGQVNFMSGLFELDTLARRLRNLARRWGADQVYAPLTIGDHVDHVRVRAAAEATGLPLRYYEDYPYAIREKRTPDWRGRAEGLSPKLLRCARQDLIAKRSAILTYVSQITSLWSTSAAFEIDFVAFHGHDHRIGEWIWVPA